eukprot:5886120-Ditylum_brightwellii.AAC.1
MPRGFRRQVRSWSFGGEMVGWDVGSQVRLEDGRVRGDSVGVRPGVVVGTRDGFARDWVG